MGLPTGYRETERDFWPLDTDSVGAHSQVRRLHKTVLDSVRRSSTRECMPAEAYTSRLIQASEIIDGIMDSLSLYWHDRPPDTFWSPLSFEEWNGPSPVDVSSLDIVTARYLQAEWMQTNLVEWYLLNGFIFDSLARTREAFLSGTAIGRTNWAYVLSGGKPGKVVLLRVGLNAAVLILRWILGPVATVLLFLTGRMWLASWVGSLWLGYVRIPRESCHPFHTKVATDSTQNLPLIP